MTKIKICGLTREADINYVNFAKPDYIGFVFAKSKRQISFEQAKALKDLTDIKAVGVFVNENAENIVKAYRMGIIDSIQLHGDEDNNYISRLMEQIDVPIIKAVRIKDKSDIDSAYQYNCDYLLFDAYSSNYYGGTGEKFNWEMLSGFDKPYFLAGGINEENALIALNKLSPFAIDVSSGAETDGIKDGEKIKKIVNLVRRKSNE